MLAALLLEVQNEPYPLSLKKQPQQYYGGDPLVDPVSPLLRLRLRAPLCFSEVVHLQARRKELSEKLEEELGSRKTIGFWVIGSWGSAVTCAPCGLGWGVLGLIRVQDLGSGILEFLEVGEFRGLRV